MSTENYLILARTANERPQNGDDCL
jgi:hypothetical protein